MIKKVPIRIRLTIAVIILLALCCLGLTLTLNHSAYTMVNDFQAATVTPALTNEAALNMGTHIIPAVPTTIIAQAVKTDYRAKSIIYMLFIVSLGGSLTYYLLGKILLPLKNLSVEMKKVNVNNLSQDIDLPYARDEIYDLTASFNEMTHKLDDAFTKQKRFSQNAAHELRTPLTVLKTKVEVFKKRQNHTKEEYDELLNVVSKNTDRLSNLVKSLLTEANMENLKLNEKISINELLKEVVTDLSSIAKNKNVSITLRGQDALLIGNKDLLFRAFYNLIENSIKYNIYYGSVNIMTSEEKGRCIIEISDTGIGIPDNLKEEIFEPLFRVDKSRSRDMGGAGLGLSIVKSIINKHNGDIEVLNNKPYGTIFKVILKGRVL